MGQLPDFFDTRSTVNKKSARQENARAKEIGGRRQPGSGSSKRAPQDVVSDTVLEQIKFTGKAVFPLKVAELVELVKDAEVRDREASFVIDFTKYGIRVVAHIERIME